MRALLVLLALTAAAVPAAGQDCPEPGTVVFPGLTGSQLQDSLRAGYRPPVGLSYAGARDVMFTEVDNHGGMVEGIYTGFTISLDPGSTDPRGEAFAAGINTEHTWPQSKGAGDVPARADLHHLFPSEIDANNARGSFPFDEIPDEDTDLWYRLRQVTTTPVPEFLDEYSELERGSFPTGYDGRWEAREDRKGDVARAMFYFYTMYRTEADREDPAFFGAQKDVLRLWHRADPADAAEHDRTCAIAPHQAGKVNPFVIDPTLVDRAYFGDVAVTWLSYAAEPAPGGVWLRWSVADVRDHAGFDVLRDGDRLTPVPIPGTVYLDAEGVPGRVYRYAVEAVGRDGSRDRTEPRTVVFPARPVVATAEPNPARAGSGVRFLLDGALPARVEVFDAAGRAATPGAPGVYFVRLVTGERAATLRLTVLP